MKHFDGWLAATKAATRRCVRVIARDDRGAVSPLFALALIPLIGAFGLAMESSNWYLQQRAMQNAADSAAIAAANNGGTTLATSCATTPGTFDCEAKATAAKFGFVDGANNTVVGPTYLTSGCPGTASTCYKVAISKKLPLTLVQVVGYRGNTTIGTRLAQTVLASATARTRGDLAGYCLLALGTGSGSKSGITINGGGGPGNATNIDLGGCDVFSNNKEVCNGSNNKANFGIGVGGTAGSSTTCGADHEVSQPLITEASLAFDSLPVPANTCGAAANYHWIGDANYATQSGNHLTGPQSWGTGAHIVCGDLSLSGNTTITGASPGSILVVENGQLNLNGFTLQNASGAGMTIIFSGTGGDSHVRIPTGSGTLNIGAPTSGTWSGVALFQDPAAATQPASGKFDITYTGNTPAFDLTGLLYMPKADLVISGAINHQIAGLACFGIVALDMAISGGGSIFPNPTSQCKLAGLTLPGVPGTEARPALIQ
jgi:Flp pilus assembly protein TadG